MPETWHPEPRRESTGTVLRLVVAVLVIGGAYAALSVWASRHVPASVSVGGIEVGGMTSDTARATLERDAQTVLTTPITLTVPGRDEPVEVVPGEAGLRVDVDRSLEGLTGFTLDPRTVWDKLTQPLRLPLLTSADDERLTAYVTDLASRLAVAPVEGEVSFPGGVVETRPPRPGSELDVASTKLALRRAFPDASVTAAVVRTVEPRVPKEAVQRFSETVARTAVGQPVTLVAGATKVVVRPVDFASLLRVEPDGAGGLRLAPDEAGLARLVARRVAVPTKTAQNARWVFATGNGAPRLVPAVDGAVVDEDAVGRAFAAAIAGTSRTVAVRPVAAQPAFTTDDAVRAGITTNVAEFSVPLPANDAGTARNAALAAQHLSGRYVAPAATFSLNGVLGERTAANGYVEGTAVVDGRVTRQTGGGVEPVSTLAYNLAYFAGAQILGSSPHAVLLTGYPEGREATLSWPGVDNAWRNDGPYGMVLQAWVADGRVHGRLWSTKVWDVRSVKGPRRNVVEPSRVVSSAPRCLPQHASPGFDVTVTRQWYRPGSATLVRSEPVTTHYVPQDEVVCSNPAATAP